MGTIISIANNKGGIGKTSITCHLAAALGLRGKKVLVMDMDSQCNTTGIMLPKNTMVHHTLYELFDPETAGVPVDSCIYPTEYKNVFCLPNVEQSSGLELDLAPGFPGSLKILREKVRDQVRKRFDITLIDCPPTVGMITACALAASDKVLIPIDAGSAQSLHGLKNVLNLIGSIRDSLNPDLEFLRLAVNRMDRRTSISRTIEQDVVNRFTEDKVFHTRIPALTAFEKAEYEKETVFLRSSSSRGARAYTALARELLTTLGKEKVINGTQRFERQAVRNGKRHATGTG